jgi:hypothetical protein
MNKAKQNSEKAAVESEGSNQATHRFLTIYSLWLVSQYVSTETAAPLF